MPCGEDGIALAGISEAGTKGVGSSESEVHAGSGFWGFRERPEIRVPFRVQDFGVWGLGKDLYRKGTVGIEGIRIWELLAKEAYRKRHVSCLAEEKIGVV